ncbi:MAG: tripartite tricarboxylate transporter substrate binding protein [Rubrivivax sp.]|nr:tripartite tricarboxylate transporter substrate binding protein [Rubrivivax sp.]MCL4698324.1 tripartite tricarboxylate transporter substrate binding protein [Burkholderiaceae bacterium]
MPLARRSFVGSLMGGAFAAAVPPARAQGAWPKARSLTIVVPFSAGGSLDTTTRLVAQRLGERLGQVVVVENVTGAAGSIGFQKVMQAAPDGYTLLMAGDSPFVPGQETSATPYKFDVLKELVPVALVNTAPMVLVAHPSVGAKNLDELVDLARRQPGRLNYATSGIGTIPHLATEMIKRQAQVYMVHIPYRGAAQIANDVAGGQLELSMLISASALPHIQSRAVKPLAVTGERRLSILPQVPAVAESRGFKGFNVVSWAGLYAPAGTPAAIVQPLNQALDDVLKMDAVRGKLAETGVVTQGGPPSAFVSFIERDRAQMLRVLKVTSLKQ